MHQGARAALVGVLTSGCLIVAPAVGTASAPAAVRAAADTAVQGRIVDEHGVAINALEVVDRVGGRSTITSTTGAFRLLVVPGAVTLSLWDDAYQQFGFENTIAATATAGATTDVGTVVLRSVPDSARSTASISTSARAPVRRAVRRTLAPVLRQEKLLTPRGCRVRQVPRKAQQRVITAVNLVRRLSGLDPVQLDRSLSRKAQKAALIQHYQGFLTHYPSRRARCATKVGIAASGRSNLALGIRGAAVVLGYMSDPGASNTAAGHRRWIQDPLVETMGTGQVEQANALYVVSRFSTNNATPPTLAWPTPGWFPAELEPDGRWSFSMTRRDVSFAQVRVRVRLAGGRLALRQYPSVDGYGDQSSVVWDLAEAVAVPRHGSRTATVTISGVTQRGRTLAPITYAVRLFRAGGL